MKLKCDVCGNEKEYPDFKEAWLDGWDVMVVAGCQVNACGHCPAVDLTIKKNEDVSNT